jgi:hypothetical protein
VGDYFTSLARWTAGLTGDLPDNMVLSQDVKKGVALVRLHLDPERKVEPFASLPKVTTLRGLPGQKPEVRKAVMHWADADTLELEVALDGSETALTTVEVPGVGPRVLPPVCLPYSPEFRPTEPGAGPALLDRLARATGGKERVDLAGIWRELPKVPRLVALGPWLLLVAVVLLLLEVLERRTGLLAGRRWGLPRWERIVGPRLRLPWRKWPRAVPAETGPEPEEKVQAAPAPVAEEQPAGLLDALRQARLRSRSRKDGKG